MSATRSGLSLSRYDYQSPVLITIPAVSSDRYRTALSLIRTHSCNLVDLSREPGVLCGFPPVNGDLMLEGDERRNPLSSKQSTHLLHIGVRLLVYVRLHTWPVLIFVYTAPLA